MVVELMVTVPWCLTSVEGPLFIRLLEFEKFCHSDGSLKLNKGL
jgi:hypothetical protein